MFPSKFLQFPSILTHFHAANEKIQNGGRDLAISRGLVWAIIGRKTRRSIIIIKHIIDTMMEVTWKKGRTVPYE